MQQSRAPAQLTHRAGVRMGRFDRSQEPSRCRHPPSGDRKTLRRPNAFLHRPNPSSLTSDSTQDGAPIALVRPPRVGQLWASERPECDATVDDITQRDRVMIAAEETLRPVDWIERPKRIARFLGAPDQSSRKRHRDPHSRYRRRRTGRSTLMPHGRSAYATGPRLLHQPVRHRQVDLRARRLQSPAMRNRQRSPAIDLLSTAPE